MRTHGLVVAAAAAFLASALALAGCPTPQFPKGPPPEYEDPPAPSWLDGGGADRAAPSVPASAPDAGGNT